MVGWLGRWACVLLLAALIRSSVETGPDVYVSTEGDDTNPGTVDAPVQSLLAAKDLIQAGSTVHVGPGVFAVPVGLIVYFDLNFLGTPCTTKDSTPCTIFQPDEGTLGLSSLLHFYGKLKATIRNIEFRNSSPGGCLTVQGSHMALENCLFQNCTTEGVGGAINALTDAFVEAVNVKFVKNYSTHGGAISLLGGAATALEQCTFLENAAEEGGAIYTSLPNSTVWITSSRFEKNLAFAGGALFLRGDSVLEHVVMTSNTARGFGGGVCGSDREPFAHLSLLDCTIQTNAAIHGGGVHWGPGTLDIQGRTKFLNNTAPIGSGAGLFVWGSRGTPQKRAHVAIDRGLFYGNKCLQNGCAMHLTFTNTTLTGNPILHTNAAVMSGAATYFEYSYVYWMTGGVLLNYAGHDAGGISIMASEVFLSNVGLIANVAANRGAGLVAQESVVVLDKLQLRGNTAYRGGGAIALHNNSRIEMRDSIIEANTATLFGGGIMSRQNEEESYIRVTFRSNTLRYDLGGAYYGKDVNVTWNSCTFRDNQGHDGAAIFVSQSPEEGTQTFSNVNLRHCAFEQNQALWGTINIPGNVNVVITDSQFVNNYGSSVSAIHLGRARKQMVFLAIDSCTFERNDVGTSIPIYSTDGAIVSGLGTIYMRDGARGVIVNTNFTGNSAVGVSAGVVLRNVEGMLLEGNTFVGNRVDGTSDDQLPPSGGGLVVIGSDIALDECRFLENYSHLGSGGAMSISGHSKVTVGHSLFDGNQADKKGGALAITTASVVNVYSCQFVENTAKLGGCISSSAVDRFEMQNCVLSRNRAVNGGAIHTSGTTKLSAASSYPTSSSLPSSRVVSCQFADNVAEGGGGVFYWDSHENVIIEQSTFQNNRALYGNTKASSLWMLRSEVPLPRKTTSHRPFSPTVTVSVLDWYGNVIADDDETTVYMVVEASDAFLFGQTSAVCNKGVASFFGAGISGQAYKTYSVMIQTDNAQTAITLVSNVAIVPCFDGEHLVSRRCTPCPAGAYGFDGSECINCPRHGVCPGGADVLSVRDFYVHAHDNGKKVVLLCEPHRCLGSNQCTSGYEGVLCASCTDGLYMYGNQCREYKSGATWIAIIIAFLSLNGLAVMFVFLPERWTTIGLFSFFIQTLTLLSHEAGTTFYGNIFFFSPDFWPVCYTTLDSFDKWFIRLSIPFMVLTLMCGCWALQWLLKRLNRPIPGGCEVTCALLHLLLFSYGPMLDTSLSMFYCTALSGSDPSRVFADMSLLCSGSKYAVSRDLGICVLVLCMCVLSCICGLWLGPLGTLKTRRPLLTKFLDVLGGPYLPHRSWYCLVVLVEQTLLIVVYRTTDDMALRTLLMLIFLLGVVLVQVLLRPWPTRRDTLLSFAFLASLAFCAYMQNSVSFHGDTVQLYLFPILGAFSVAIVAIDFVYQKQFWGRKGDGSSDTDSLDTPLQSSVEGT